MIPANIGAYSFDCLLFICAQNPAPWGAWLQAGRCVSYGFAPRAADAPLARHPTCPMPTLATKTLFCLFALCSPFSAQEEVHPDLGVPEPERAPPPSSYLIVSLLYEKAVDGEDRFPMPLPEFEHRGRVVVFFSDLNISYLWSAPQETGRERAFQFGVNLMVFAMARQAAGPALR
ncbi:MAG: hypothetical protein ACI906_004972 [Candidatus Latescibacterota bacterium]|jgi:hypothetical protein